MEQQYQPSQAVLRQLRGLHVVAVVGPTGAGKTTLINAAQARDPLFRMILSDTTRAPRPGEREGVDYHFRTRQDMLARIARHEYINVAPSLNGSDIYATHPDSFPREGVGAMALFAQVVPEFRALPFGSFKVVYILPGSWKEWQQRTEAHHFTPEQLRRRWEEAARSLAFAVADKQVIFVINDELVAAQAAFCAAVREDPLPDTLIEAQLPARLLANQLLQTLQEYLKMSK